MATAIPRNEASFTLAEILEATGGALVSRGDLADSDRTTEVSTDTRSIGPGALFVALRGETFDAHDHLEKAFFGGARLLLVERDAPAPSAAAVVKVGSTLAALGRLAREHARRWRALGGVRRTIAITGSAGKTTTRVATQALLERLHPGEVHATKGNLNNLVGAPMVLFGLLPVHRYAVVEIGTNRPGEIEALARIVEPDVGVITLVAAAHVEELGSIEGVAHEKAALFRALRADGVAIGNGDSDLVRAHIEASPARTKVLYGTRDDATVRILARAPDGMTRSGVRLALDTDRAIDLVTPLLGEAGAYACAAALAIAERGLGERVSAEIANEALASAEVGGGAGRLVPVLVGRDVVVVDDSYNANPASMRASIRAAAEIAAAERRRLVLVLGEMRELGAAAEAGHDEVGQAARDSGAALVIAVGSLATRYTVQLLGSAVTHVHVGTAEDAAAFGREWIMPNDLVLVKGSRGIGTDAVVRALRAHFGAAPQGERHLGGHP
jgi:UDP-N-acetylmuramoyl-tripeptide--D-alanyl-D-alanine ligase